MTIKFFIGNILTDSETWYFFWNLFSAILCNSLRITSRGNCWLKGFLWYLFWLEYYLAGTLTSSFAWKWSLVWYAIFVVHLIVWYQLQKQRGLEAWCLKHNVWNLTLKWHELTRKTDGWTGIWITSHCVQCQRHHAVCKFSTFQVSFLKKIPHKFRLAAN